MIFAAITTAPRQQPKLAETLTSLDLAGFGCPLLFCEPNTSLPDAARWLPRVQHRRRHGPYPNFLSVIDFFAARTSDRDDHLYLICQDDIQMTPGLVDWIPANLPRDDGFGVASLYCPAPLATGRGWFQIKFKPGIVLGVSVPGALAYIFTRRSLLHFAKFCRRRCGLTKTDYWVGLGARDNEMSYWVHSPSFVKHTGEVSSLDVHDGINQWRQCGEFVEGISKDGFAVEQVWREPQEK